MKRLRDVHSTGGRRSQESKLKRRKKSHRSSSPSYSSPMDQRGQSGRSLRRSTGDLEFILQNFVEMRFRMENLEEKLNTMEYILKNIERVVESRNALGEEKKNKSCIIM